MRFDLVSSQFVASARSDQALAVVGSDRSLSWQELHEQAHAWAKEAQRLVGRERCVGGDLWPQRGGIFRRYGRSFVDRGAVCAH